MRRVPLVRLTNKMSVLHRLDLARTPFLGEERLKRAVEPQARNKSFTGHGLDPVAPFDTRRLGRTEIDRGRAVGARFRGGRWKALAARAWVALRCVEH